MTEVRMLNVADRMGSRLTLGHCGIVRMVLNGEWVMLKMLRGKFVVDCGVTIRGCDCRW
jgi:hypothetical protein